MYHSNCCVLEERLGSASESVRQALGLGPLVQVIEMRQLPDWQVDAECRLERGAALVGGGHLEEGLSMWQSVTDTFPGTSPASGWASRPLSPTQEMLLHPSF